MIVVGSDLENSERAIKLAQKSRHLYASVGLHPIHIRGGWGLKRQSALPPSFLVDDFESATSRERSVGIKKISRLLTMSGVVALGEIGLDYHSSKERPKINKDIQKIALNNLIDLGKESDLPMIFHCRDAIEDFFDLLKRKKDRIRGVMHCFPGDTIDAKRAFDLGLYISFTGLITFTRDFDEVVRYAPIDRIMIETDCPFLTPEPYRGQRNEPAYVVEIARRIAEIKDIPLYKVAQETTANAIKLFGLE
jgi:TatD DNase family protein